MHTRNKKVHFIAIGGSVMHGLAIAMHQQGYQVSGSDDQITGLSKMNLEKHGLLPEPGWDASRITEQLDGVILGMHAKKNNPELKKAQDLGLKIYSYPSYIMEQCQDKQRIVIAGSHGKTSITAMIIHVLQYLNKEFDYLIGSKVAGFDNLIRISEAPVIIIEGDEYLSSAIDDTPKFLQYRHHIGLISGIAWDHMNVFPTEENYVHQFDKFADSLPKAGSIVFCEEDGMASVIGNKERTDVNRVEYKTHPHFVKDGKTYLTTDSGDVPLLIFGSHNMQNIAGAKAVLARLGVTDEQFYQAITTFKGANRRLEMVNQNHSTTIYKDFAHAPSKAKATIKALKEQSARELVACLELHTYSSLNKDFLPQYSGKLSEAEYPVVYFNPETLANKNLPDLNEDSVKKAFNLESLEVFTDKNALVSYLMNINWQNKNLVMMSSGDFGGIDLQELGKDIISRCN